MPDGNVYILAEDRQHHSFVRRVLKTLGFHTKQISEIDPQKDPTRGRTFVLDNFPHELAGHRSRFTRVRSRRLLVVIDADEDSVEATKRRLNDRAIAVGIEPRRSREGVAFVVPKREIENWLEHLGGRTVTETEKCAKRIRREGSVGDEAKKFAQCVQQPDAMPPGILPSMADAVEEFRTQLLVDLSAS